MSETFTLQSPRKQTFHLTYSLIQYIKTNYTLIAYEKLIKTCKYFLAESRIIPIDLLNWQSSSFRSWKAGKYSNDQLYLRTEDLDGLPFKLWLTGSLTTRVSLPSKTVSTLLEKAIHRCAITELSLTDQELTYIEMVFLLGSKTIRSLELCETAIMYDEVRAVPLETILEFTPQLITFWMFDYKTPSKLTANTTKVMAEMPPLTKLKVFSCQALNECFDPIGFCAFVRRHDAQYYYLKWKNDISNEFMQHFQECLTEMDNIWEVDKRKPEIVILRDYQ